MSVNLWRAKRLTKRIERYQSYIKKTSEWFRKDKKDLNKLLKRLSREEYLKYGYEMGFVEKADYQVMLSEVKNENKNL